MIKEIKTYGHFQPLPSGSIVPTGWLRDWAQVNAEGWLLDYARQRDPRVYGKLWNRNTTGAVSSNANGETLDPPDYAAYFADGLLRYAQIFSGSAVAREAELWVEHVLAAQDEDGYIGAFAPQGRWQHWLEVFTQSLVIEALLYRYEATGDPALLQACIRAAESQIEAWQTRPSRMWDGFGIAWEGQEDVSPSIFGSHGTITVRVMGKLFALTGQARFLEYARAVLKRHGKVQSYLRPARKLFCTNPDDALAGEHNVMETEHVGLPAMLYEYNGEPELLAASEAAWQMMVRYHLSVAGTPHGDEPMLKVGPRENAEHCGTIEWIITSNALARVTGNVAYADEVEHAIFNAYPGARSPDGMTVGYMHTPNQLVAAEWSSSTFYNSIEDCARQHYHSAHEPLCCNANGPRGLVHYLDAMVLRYADGIAVALYGPCQATASLPDGGRATITMDTDYPFEDDVAISVVLEVSATFSLQLRIPGWCSSALLFINGEPLESSATPGSYAEIRRTWHSGDRVTLHFENPVRVLRWDQSRHDFGVRSSAVVIRRGPLTFALPVKENWQRFSAPAQAPTQKPDHVISYRVLPAKDAAWNYALCLDRERPEQSITLTDLPVPAGCRPWEHAPLGLQVKARRVLNWLMDGEPEHPMTPGLPYKPLTLSAEEETVTLIPFGFTHLRLTYMPVVPDVE